LLEVAISVPLLSAPNAAQNPFAHETPLNAPPGIAAICHAALPPVGLLEVSTFPLVSTATHSDADGHEMPAMSR
jgi:hypothetical protein